MPDLFVTVQNKIATYFRRNGSIVCGNSDYTITFSFDDEWDGYPTKTARFIWNGEYLDVGIVGNSCTVPAIHNATEVKVGVFVEDFSTTTPAVIPCRGSILCVGGRPSEGHDEFYATEAQRAAQEAAGSATEAGVSAHSATVQANRASDAAQDSARSAAAAEASAQETAEIVQEAKDAASSAAVSAEQAEDARDEVLGLLGGMNDDRGLIFDPGRGDELPDASWAHIVRGDDKFIAFAAYGKTAAHSADGKTWEQITVPVNANAVAYGNGVFVALSGSAGAAYSTDGINWTETTMPTSSSWCSVAYGGGKFVAMCNDNDTAAISEDGINWTEITMPDVGTGYNWCSVAYGAGKFVAVPRSTSSAFENNPQVAYSTDGTNWTLTAVPKAQYGYNAIAYGGGKFVAIAYMTGGSYGIGCARAAHSTDGINWVASTGTTPPAREYVSIAYGRGAFVAVSEEVATGWSGDAVYSTDGGATWQKAAMPEAVAWKSVAYGGGKFVAVSNSSLTPAISENGLAWSGKSDPALRQDGEDVTKGVRTILLPGGSDDTSAIPAFDLTSLGLPTVSMAGGTAEAKMDVSEITAALALGPVKFALKISDGIDEIPTEVVMTSVSASDLGTYICTAAVDFNSAPMLLNLYFQDGGVIAYITILSKYVQPPTSIDLSALDTEGKVVETYADGAEKTTVMEFDEAGNPVKITDGDGNVTTLTW